ARGVHERAEYREARREAAGARRPRPAAPAREQPGDANAEDDRDVDRRVVDMADGIELQPALLASDDRDVGLHQADHAGEDERADDPAHLARAVARALDGPEHASVTNEVDERAPLFAAAKAGENGGNDCRAEHRGKQAVPEVPAAAEVARAHATSAAAGTS